MWPLMACHLLVHKARQGLCPEYFTEYFKHVRSTHCYRTRSAICNEVLIPSCKRISGLKTIHSSACRPWNNLDNSFYFTSFIFLLIFLWENSYRNITCHTNFRKMLQNNLIKENSSLDYFNTTRTF